jgi:hypothetical protein
MFKVMITPRGSASKIPFLKDSLRLFTGKSKTFD